MALTACIRQGRRCVKYQEGILTAVIQQHHQLQLTSNRYNASSSKNKVDNKIAKYSEEAPSRQNVRGYLFGRFIDYVSNYDKILEKRFPQAMQVYRVFMVGVKDFYRDMKRFLKVTRIANQSPEGLRALTRQEIEIYHQLPKDIVTIAPVLLVSALPFANYVVFPLAYMYPRLFLTSHFWTNQQKIEFNQVFLKHRVSYNKPVFRCLQAKLGSLKDERDEEKMGDILGLLGSGRHPSVEQILSTKDIFAKPPFQLESLNNRHLFYLCRNYNVRAGPFKRGRLAERSYLVHHMDLAIKREGGVHNMPTEALRLSCFIRGLNPVELSNEELIDWLRAWVTVSAEVDGKNVSLFLHMPILLGYNHPNNWKLIH